MRQDRRELIEQDEVLQSSIERGLIPLFYFTKYPRSIRHLGLMGEDTPRVSFISNMAEHNKNPGSRTVTQTLSPCDFLAFQAHEKDAGRKMPQTHIMSSTQYYDSARRGELPFAPEDEVVVIMNISAKKEQDPACIISFSPALMKRFETMDLSAYQAKVREDILSTPLLWRPDYMFDDTPSPRKLIKVSPSEMANAPSDRVLPYTEEGRVVFSDDMRVAAVSPETAKVLKSGYWPEASWDQICTALKVNELPRTRGPLFNKISLGGRMAWIFNCAHNNRDSTVAIIPADLALNALEFGDDGYIEGIFHRPERQNKHAMMGLVRTNYETTHVTLSPDTQRTPGHNGKRRALRVDLPAEQRVNVRNALSTNSSDLIVQGQRFHLSDVRPLNRREGALVSRSLGRSASMVFDEVVDFQERRSMVDGSSDTKISLGYRPNLSHLVIANTKTLIVRAAGEEFEFEAVSPLGMG